MKHMKFSIYNRMAPMVAIALLLITATGCRKDLYQLKTVTCTAETPMNAAHPMKDSLQRIIDKFVQLGIPGVQVTVKNADGWYFASGGYASLEDQATFRPCTPGWLFSLTKTYTAALVMKSAEQGLIQLDQPIGPMLPAEYAGYINGQEKITVRMLLNHSSGIINMTELPEFQVDQLNHPLQQPSVAGLMRLLRGKPLLFDPGSDFSYSNANFLVLQVILEKVRNKSYEQLLREDILQPLSLQQTYYAPGEEMAASLGFPNYYFDRFANAQLENITRWNNKLGAASYGYGGIAATAADAIRFYEALFTGKVISPASLQEMRTWVKGKNSEQPDYGLGLEYYQYQPGTEPQYGHEGDGIGCTTQMFYSPASNTYMYINCTAGRQLFGPYLFKTTDMKNELCRYVAGQ